MGSGGKIAGSTGSGNTSEAETCAVEVSIGDPGVISTILFDIVFMVLCLTNVKSVNTVDVETTPATGEGVLKNPDPKSPMDKLSNLTAVLMTSLLDVKVTGTNEVKSAKSVCESM